MVTQGFTDMCLPVKDLKSEGVIFYVEAMQKIFLLPWQGGDTCPPPCWVLTDKQYFK